ALAQPQAPALHCEGRRLSYGQLEQWASQIGRRLHETGVQAEERVGLCVTRSVAMVAGLLGIFKSGGAFLPLDPDYPADRLALMLEDAGVRTVLADADTATRLADVLAGRQVIRLDQLDGVSTQPFHMPVLADQLAYVIYTSGSTGRPKGVAISQRALSLHLDDFIHTYGISAQDKQLQSSTINFDVALHEMLPALIQGGQVEMRGAQPWDLETTSRQLAQEGVTFSRLATAYWQQWLRNPPAP
ncbi:AMP-binding protein, partial [Herbaspirillum rhizosphaerae]|uniref:AMP-binding protein n=1 Tax=Herbaspirillum rhizosphaerae TaxID=346179 RepID=UPI0012EEA2E8